MLSFVAEPIREGNMMAIQIDNNRIRHIFRAARGHLPDTPSNRRLLEMVANDPQAFLGRDNFGNDRFGRLLADGRQVWVQVREGVIVNGGANSFPRAKEKK
jgi:hypothetical protein